MDDNFSFSESTVRHELKSTTSPYLEVESIVLDNNSSMISSSSLALKVGDYTLGKIPRMKFRTDGRKANFKLMIGERNPLWLVYCIPKYTYLIKSGLILKRRYSVTWTEVYTLLQVLKFPPLINLTQLTMLSLELGGVKG